MGLFTKSKKDSYKIKDGICTVTFEKTGELTSERVKEIFELPEVKECKAVNVEIGDGVITIDEKAFDGRTSLTSIKIPKGITRIGKFAFNSCTRLTSVEIPEGVTSIDIWAFHYCTGLISVELPNSVATIGDRAFYDCESLTSITVDEGNQAYKSIDGNLYTKDGKTLVQYAIGKEDARFKIPDGVTTIGEEAFYACESLDCIEIPKGVETIGNFAFSHCKSLTSIELPEGAKTIGAWAFYACSALARVVIPKSVTTIGDRAFHDCSIITSITVDEENQAYKSVSSNLYTKDGQKLIKYAVGKENTRFAIPEGVTGIGDYAFYGCESLISILLPESLASIGDFAFGDCFSLASIEIPKGVTVIGENAFSCCSDLSICCEAEGQPSTWKLSWNPNNRPVKWGHEIVRKARKGKQIND